MNNKAIILGDLHFGIRNGSKSFNDYFELFFKNIFFPYVINNNIRKVIQVGDIFDDRKYMHIRGLTECRKYFFDKLKENDIELIILIGNHDSHYRDTIKVNSPSILLKDYTNIQIIEEPTEIEIIPGIKSLILPWICKENYDASIEKIKNCSAEICFGHLELKNFSMYKGILNEDGMESSIFDKFEYVITGHYHHRSNKGNIYYTGTPYELTWNDDSDPKGFHIFDFETRTLEFIQNPYKMFNKIYYDDILMENDIKSQLSSNYFDQFSNTYIKVIVKNKNNTYLFDMFMNELEKLNPIDLVLIEDLPEILNEEINDVDETEDTITILFKYVDNIKTKELESSKLKIMLNNLYNEALSLDSI